MDNHQHLLNIEAKLDLLSREREIHARLIRIEEKVDSLIADRQREINEIAATMKKEIDAANSAVSKPTIVER